MTETKTTVISHFYNEEFLLPFWLRHHVKIFDHGIMIDYASTDRSIDIIKDIAPHWQIVKSRNKMLHYIECDKEVMEIESSIDGWKTALNTTEFMHHSNLKELLLSVPEYVKALRPVGIVMVEAWESRNNPLTDQQLLFQKKHGYVEPGPTGRIDRQRIIHRAEHGDYAHGRHVSFLPDQIDSDELFICWFGWCPMDFVLPRKLQIKDRIPPEHLEDGKGFQHEMTEEEMRAAYILHAREAVDLWYTIPKFRNHIIKMLESGH